MEDKEKRRYPGLNYFTTAEASLFFGRTEEIEALSNLLVRNRKTLLYGKSGLGKTSLINAGIIPYLTENHGWAGEHFIYCRFKNYVQNEVNTPVASFEEAVRAQISKGDNPLADLKVIRTNLWLTLLEYRLNKNIPWSEPIILILDQFEELASYPEFFVDEFGDQLSDIYYQGQPKSVNRIIRSAFIKQPELEETFAQKGMLANLQKDVNAKLLFSIRKDRLDFIKLFQKKYIPRLLDEAFSFEIKPLSIEGAKDAIVKPALAKGKFYSPIFQYDEEVVRQILNTLNDTYIGNEIESFQLQLVCYHIEEGVHAGNFSKKQITVDFFKEGFADVAEMVNEILNNHYEQAIKKLDDHKITVSRKLIEEELISKIGKRRLSRDHEIIVSYLKSAFKEVMAQTDEEADKNTAELLDDLQKTRLIRAEPNSIGGFNYELSHDTLLEPVSKSKEERRKKEELVKEKIKTAKSHEVRGYRSFRERNYREARFEFQSAYDILTEFPNELESLIHMALNLGRTLTVERLFKEAEQQFKDAKELAIKIGTPAISGQVYESMGNFYRRLKRFGGESVAITNVEIVGYLQKAKDYYIATENPEHIARVLESLGLEQMANRNYALAEEYFQQAKSNLLAAGQFILADKIDLQLEQLNEQIVLETLDVPWGYLKNLRTNKINKLDEEDPVLIGRNTQSHTSNTIDFQVQIISRRHLSIRRKGLALEDLRSLNGTTLNSAVLPYGITQGLQNGDVLTLANEIVLQFTTEQPAPLVIPKDYWGLLLSQSYQKYHYLVAGDYYISIDGDDSIILETEQKEDSILRISFDKKTPKFFILEGKWQLTTIVKKVHEINYETFILPKKQWNNAFNFPSQFVELEDNSNNKIKSLGPSFQFLFKDLYGS